MFKLSLKIFSSLSSCGASTTRTPSISIFLISDIKFGIGRATYDASQEIRNKHLTRDEGKNLVKKYDGELQINIFLKLWNI